MASSTVPLDLDAMEVPAGWKRIEEGPVLRPQTGFLSSIERVTVRYFTRGEADEIVSLTRFGSGTEGPPGHAHGGSIASVLDEIMGFACLFRDMPVLAARIEVDFRIPLPIPNVVMAVGRIVRVDGRKLSTTGVLQSFDGSVYAESTGLFIRLPAETIVNMG